MNAPHIPGSISPGDPFPRPRWVPVQELRFDNRNPRLQEEHDGESTQEDLLAVLWRDFAVDEVALSIAANGYFEHEPLFATREGDSLVVVEGNRRLAAVRLLLDEAERERVGAGDLPALSPDRQEDLKELPVIECARDAIWNYVGFKHVNGPQVWQSYAKAEYIAWVRNTLGIPLPTIALHIGDKHETVRRLYRAFMALEQAKEAGVFDRADRYRRHFSFSHLYTGLDYSGFRDFTGIAGDESYSERPIPLDKMAEFGEVCEWLYGSKSRDRQPVIRSQNPDLRYLDEVLQGQDATAALRGGLPLDVCLDIGRGDERLFREAMVVARRKLQEARGRLLTGYKGERDLLELAADIRDLATNVYAEMHDISARPNTRGEKNAGTKS